MNYAVLNQSNETNKSFMHSGQSKLESNDNLSESKTLVGVAPAGNGGFILDIIHLQHNIAHFCESKNVIATFLKDIRRR